MMDDTLQQLNNAIDSFLKIDLRSISWDYKQVPEKWSKKEVMGHLIDSAQINLQRFVRCTYEENFKLVYEQVDWVKAQHYQSVEINELLILWRALNMQIVHVLKNYPQSRLQVQCDTGKITESFHTVEWLVKDYVVHLKHHLSQIL